MFLVVENQELEDDTDAVLEHFDQELHLIQTKVELHHHLSEVLDHLPDVVLDVDQGGLLVG